MRLAVAVLALALVLGGCMGGKPVIEEEQQKESRKVVTKSITYEAYRSLTMTFPRTALDTTPPAIKASLPENSTFVRIKTPFYRDVPVATLGSHWTMGIGMERPTLTTTWSNGSLMAKADVSQLCCAMPTANTPISGIPMASSPFGQDGQELVFSLSGWGPIHVEIAIEVSFTDPDPDEGPKA
jgi:hypothetical protein